MTVKPQFLKRGEVGKVVDDVEKQLVICWEFLAGMIQGKLETESMSLLQFQPTLANVIFKFSSLHRKIELEKRYLIARKNRYSKFWFPKRMGFLAKQQELLDAAISICRGLGDGFVWYFYQRDRQYLSEHLAEQLQQYTPSGIGGIGELEFIKNVPQLHGYMVLYHGITNILRLGDISLIDVKNLRVAGIGELKTYPLEPGELKLNLIFSGPGLLKELGSVIDRDATKDESKIEIRTQLSPKAEDRLNRQMRRIDNSYKKLGTKPEKTLAIDHDGYYEKFNTFVCDLKAGKFSYYQLGESLLLIGYKSNPKTLFQKLSGSKSLSKYKLDELDKHLEKIALNDSEYNTIILGSFYYKKSGRAILYPGMTHLIWWPLNLNVIKEILFQDVTVLTILNPAHLLELLKDKGYTVKKTTNGNFDISKIIDQGTYQLQNVFYYYEMIQQYLFNEEGILEFLTQAEKHVSGLDKGKRYQIELMIEQKFGSRLDN